MSFRNRSRLASELTILLSAWASGSVLSAQAPTRASFDVASVRPNRSNAPAESRFPLGPGDAFVLGDLFAASNQPLIAYLRFAYKLGAGDLLGLPGWVYTETFDIEARASGNPTKDQMRLMMRSLLADRFQVRTHTEQRTKPVFNLVLANNGKRGSRLLPDSDDGACPPLPEAIKNQLQLPSIPCGSIGPLGATAPDSGRLGGRRVTMAQLAGILSNPFTGVDRPVLDRTGLAGTFDFTLDWSLAPDKAQPPGEDTGPTFREALQRQLGLRLTTATAPVDVLVIDRVERPEEN